MAGLGLRQRMQVPQGKVGVARSACGQMPFFPSHADPPPPQAASHTDTKEPVVLCLALGAMGAGEEVVKRRPGLCNIPVHLYSRRYLSLQGYRAPTHIPNYGGALYN